MRISTRAIVLGGVVAAGLAACACSRARVDAEAEVGVALRPGGETREGTMAGFSCEHAGEGFGLAGAVVEQCAELLPGFYRAVLSGAGLPYATIFRGVWVGEARVDSVSGGTGSETEGLARLEAWARAVKLYEAPKLDAWPVGQVLEVLGAFPPQFDSESVASVSDPATGERGGVQRSPFVVTAYKVGYVQAAGAATPPSADGPAVNAGPPGGPSGPSGLAGPGGPGGGYAPAVVARARLVGSDDYRFRWEIEVRQPGGAWTALRDFR